MKDHYVARAELIRKLAFIEVQIAKSHEAVQKGDLHVSSVCELNEESLIEDLREEVNTLLESVNTSLDEFKSAYKEAGFRDGELCHSAIDEGDSWVVVIEDGSAEGFSLCRFWKKSDERQAHFSSEPIVQNVTEKRALDLAMYIAIKK